MQTHVRTFRVRFYECDAYGHVNNTTYLRYMQEAAFDASASVGFDVQRYESMQRHWLIRESEIEYLRPVRYGDVVAVTTWIEDFRRVRSRRRYEFRREGDAELVARASTDWVFINAGSGLPATIPDELVTAFFPSGLRPAPQPRQRFPPQPPPPPGAFIAHRRVTWQDIDAAQHVNNAVYLAYVEDAGVQICTAYGWPMRRMMAEGFGIIARRHQIEYREPALLDDDLEIATWVSHVRRATAMRHYSIRRARDRALLVQVSTLWVWVDLASGRPIHIPRQFIGQFADNIATG